MRPTSLVVIVAVFLTAARSSYGAPPDAPTVAPSSPAPPRDLDKARVHFSRGVALYREGDFRAALAEFNRANALGPSYRILFNIGQAQVELRDYPAAMKTFDRYLKDGGSELAQERRDEVAAVIATCRERVAEVTVHVNRPNAEIFVDEVSVGRGERGEPIIVGAGRRKISAVVDGLPPVVRTIEITGRDRVSVELLFDEPVAQAVAGSTAPVTAHVPLGPAPAPPPSHAPFWASVIVTGALGAATLATGMLALSAKGRLDDELGRFPPDDGHIAIARTGVKTASLATDILGAATLVGAGVTTYFAFTTLGSAKSTTVRVGIGPGTVAAGGQF